MIMNGQCHLPQSKLGSGKEGEGIAEGRHTFVIVSLEKSKKNVLQTFCRLTCEVEQSTTTCS